MTWFKIDDGWWRSLKLARLPKRKKVSVSVRVAAAGVWSLCGDWSADQLTDGFVPWDQVEEWDPSHVLAAHLIAAGFWTEEGDAGIRFHGWDEWQPTRADVEKKRALVRERVRRHREVTRESVRGPSGPSGSYPQPPENGPPGPDGEPPAERHTTDDQPEQLSEPVSNGVTHGAGNAPGNALQDALVTAPPSRPVPTSTSKGDSGRRVPDSNALPRAAAAPRLDPNNPRCSRHADLPIGDPGPNCRGCRDVRRHLEAQPGANNRQAELDARHACRHCDADGWVIDPQHRHRGPTTTRCDHQPHLRSVTA